MKKYISTLTIAGSDSSGGAGVQADIKTMSSLGMYAASVITSVTAQNTCGVSAIHVIPADIIAAQIKAVMEDIRPEAIKVGMLNDCATMNIVADTLKEYDIKHLVIDPVMVATSGDRLMKEDAINTFIDRLLPMADVLTPNLPEAEILAGMKINSKDDVYAAADRIIAKGCETVLIKGGHSEGADKTDYLFYKNEKGERDVMVYTCKTVNTKNTHGTGCTLSSAIASFLAEGLPMCEAVKAAKNYVTEALEGACDVHIGEGHGPVNHFYNPIATIKK